MKRVKGLFLLAIVLLLGFAVNVKADTCYFKFYTDASSNLKNGDVIELYAEYAGSGPDFYEIDLFYDSSVFELISAEFPDTMYRTEWENITEDYINTDNPGYIVAKIAGTHVGSAGLAPLKVKYSFRVQDTNYASSVISATSYGWLYEDGKSSCGSDEYTFIINDNSSSNNYLQSLTVYGVSSVDYQFDKDTLNYSGYVNYYTNSVYVEAVAESSGASISGLGYHELQVGDNNIDIVVTAEDGSQRTYTYKVYREQGDSDTTLSVMKVTGSDGKQVALGYDSKTKTFSGTVPANISSVDFEIKFYSNYAYLDIEASDFKEKVNTDGSPAYGEIATETLKDGENVFKFVVVPQTQEKVEYKIVLTKEAMQEQGTKPTEEPKSNEVNKMNVYLMTGIGVLALICVFLFIILLIQAKKKEDMVNRIIDNK